MKKYSVLFKKVALWVTGVAILPCIFYLSVASLNAPSTGNRQLLSLIMTGIGAVHYSPQPVNDSFSEKIFSEFLKRVDYNKKIFTQQDIKELSKYKNTIDNEISDSSYAFFDATMVIYSQRIEQAYRYSKLPLETRIDFTTDESVETDGDKLTYPADTTGVRNEWRKYMKLQVLQQIYNQSERQEKAKAKSDTVKLKSFEQLEEEARKQVKKSNEEFFSRVHEIEYNDWMASYLNCISNVEDPHTEYFPPVQKQNFDIQMSGQLEGIGAQLQSRDGEIKVTSIVPGSASWRQGQLKAGDVILKVAQGSLEPVNVEGMRLDKAIQLIRGKKGTEVRLTIKKPDGTLLVIPIVRDIVVIEATYAQSMVIRTGSKKIGYIRLPEFYTPMPGGGRSSAKDLKEELLKLKAEQVSGLILDLRDNGGGSLQEAVRMAGLFIAGGPMVQVRSRAATPNVMTDTDPEVVYDGPLTVMVNENSASASEIVAAALQDYHRAVVIGSRNTYGKGTVQNFYDLDDFVSNPQNTTPKLGSLKITIQKYYRVTGGSTQLKGVTSDIVLPDAYAEIPNGEKEDEFAIPWDEITPAKYNPWGIVYNIPELRARSEKRVAASPPFQLVEQEAHDYKQRNDNTTYSLNYKKFSAEQERLNELEKKYDAITSDSTLVDVSNLAVDVPRISADSTRAATNEQFLKNLRRDIYLHEVAQVTGEMK